MAAELPDASTPPMSTATPTRTIRSPSDRSVERRRLVWPREGSRDQGVRVFPHGAKLGAGGIGSLLYGGASVCLV